MHHDVPAVGACSTRCDLREHTQRRTTWVVLTVTDYISSARAARPTRRQILAILYRLLRLLYIDL